MRRIVFHKSFDKHYVKRIKPQPKLVKQFEERYALFLAGELGYPLDDHPLWGKLAGKRAFSITSDIRVVYENQEDVIAFLDVGTHNQVY